MWCQNYCHRLQSPSQAPPTILLLNPQKTLRPCHAEQQRHRNMSKRLTLMDETRSADLQCYTLTQRMEDLTEQLLWDGSRLTWCIVKTNSQCLSCHHDVNTFQFQQATIFTTKLLFQPQLITTMYIQLQIIIYKSSVCFTRMHTDMISYMRCKKSSDASITTKDITLLNLFW